MQWRPSREEMIETLTKIAASHCGYSIHGKLARVCDCKYGFDPTRSERSGCPELRAMMELLDKMGDLEYFEIFQREPSG